MNGKDRFNRVMNFETVDRSPLFEDGIREDVMREWRHQGLKKIDRLEELFTFDHREEIEPDLDPIPLPTHYPKTINGLKKMAGRLNPLDDRRLPDGWKARVSIWKDRDYPLILRVHRGYFLTLGVHAWRRFTDAAQLLVDDPLLVNSWMKLYSDLSCHLIERILSEVQVDAALFSEPIGGNHGPLISPKMYDAFVLDSYRPIIQLLISLGVKTIIYRTYANTRALLSSVVKAGFNCLWACECNPEAMDYRDIRQEYGKDLRLIGGIDSDALRQDQQQIYYTIMDVVPGLLESGGYIPLADGRVREDVPFDNYVYYRKLLESIATTHQQRS